MAVHGDARVNRHMRAKPQVRAHAERERERVDAGSGRGDVRTGHRVERGRARQAALIANVATEGEVRAEETVQGTRSRRIVLSASTLDCWFRRCVSCGTSGPRSHLPARAGHGSWR